MGAAVSDSVGEARDVGGSSKTSPAGGNVLFGGDVDDGAGLGFACSCMLGDALGVDRSYSSCGVDCDVDDFTGNLRGRPRGRLGGGRGIGGTGSRRAAAGCTGGGARTGVECMGTDVSALVLAVGDACRDAGVTLLRCDPTNAW